MAGTPVAIESDLFPGGTVDDLVADGTQHLECARIFRINKTDADVTGQPLQLHTIRLMPFAKPNRAAPVCPNQWHRFR